MADDQTPNLQAQLDAANARIAELETSPPPATPADAQPAATAPEQGNSSWSLDPQRGPLYHGVPLLDLDNPFGGFGVGVLIGLDLDAKHEAGQRKMIPGSDPPEYEPVPKTGGAAYYQDFLGSHGWTVALNPEGK